MVDIKSESDIRKMRVAGKLAADVLTMIGEYVKSGISTGELDKICHDYIINQQKAIPAPLNYRGFPKSICTSVNHQVCHGIPSNEKILKDGDIVNIDVTVIKDGFHGDTSKMFLVGKSSILAERLCRVTRECMIEAINIVKPGLHIGDIGAVIEEHAHNNNFSVVRDYCGHGIGKNFHEMPQILHYGNRNTGMKLLQGMTFTIEPMINEGRYKTKVLNDGWTVVTQDRSLSAQWEHTVLVTKNGSEILTLRSDENI
ncbi:MAG: type I methionyl aminopeptidase [Gammaproteobacteria bacterium]|nr:type I methionyl aminopeptidase [Gammaproteobacteria bacterium]